MTDSTDLLELREAIRQSAQDLLRRTDHRARQRQLARQAVAWERPAWQTLVEAGWLAMMIPESLGGLGLELADVVVVAEAVGDALLPEPWLGAGVLPVMALLHCQAVEHVAARDILLGTCVASLAWQESEGQLTPDVIHTRAHATAAGLQLDGCKIAVAPGGGEDGWLVLAQGPDTPVLVWVGRADAGVHYVSSPRIDGSRLGVLTLNQVVVAEHQVIARGAGARDAVVRALEVGRIVQAAELLGVARHCLTTTLEHVTLREQFGKPIGSFQALQHRLVDAGLQIELAAASLSDAVGQLRLTMPLTDLANLASRVQARAGRAAQDIARLAVQLHGAIGYTDELALGLYVKRAMHLTAWLGTPAAHQRRYGDQQRLQPDATAGVMAPAPTDTPDFPRDADWEQMPEAEFRAMLRRFFQAHYPAELRHLPGRVHWEQIRSWYFTLSRQGWIAPGWPREFGGMALPPDKLIAYIEEQESYGVARPPDQGLVMLGPILIRYGTPAQQARYLPRILSGDDVWAQGYSEPNAGSDLAALRTEARLEGDVFILNGQKTWSTLAQDANRMFVLARTDPAVKKQAGISFLLVDLTAPGVSVRPIRTLGGDEEFAEVFFDNVRVPKEDLVGELNQGWTIAKTLLGLERLFSGSPKHARNTLAQIQVMAQHRGLLDDPVFVYQWAGLLLDVADLSALYGHFAGMVKQGKALPPAVSYLKIWATETHERLSLMLIEMADESGGMPPELAWHESSVHVTAPVFNAMAAKIFSGSNEIQRNILARTVLGLPG